MLMVSMMQMMTISFKDFRNHATEKVHGGIASLSLTLLIL